MAAISARLFRQPPGHAVEGGAERGDFVDRSMSGARGEPPRSARGVDQRLDRAQKPVGERQCGKDRQRDDKQRSARSAPLNGAG